MSAGIGKVVEGGKRMRLAAAELRDQRQDRCSIGGLARQAAEHHADMVFQRPRKASARKELFGPAVILGRRSGDDLLERDGKFVRAKGAPLANLAARNRNFIPRFHSEPPYDEL